MLQFKWEGGPEKGPQAEVRVTQRIGRAEVYAAIEDLASSGESVSRSTVESWLRRQYSQFGDEWSREFQHLEPRHTNTLETLFPELEVTQ